MADINVIEPMEDGVAGYAIGDVCAAFASM
jgi:hypothetical protein